MAAWYDKASAIAADTVYCDGELVARDVTVSLPELSAITAELNAGGTLEVPISNQFEPMEASLTKMGVTYDIAKVIEPKRHTLEIRAVEDVLTADEKRVSQIKAFLGAIPKGVPALSLEFGSIPENEITFAVLRYQLYVDNREVLLIDKPNGIYRVNGVDYSSSIESYL